MALVDVPHSELRADEQRTSKALSWPVYYSPLVTGEQSRLGRIRYKVGFREGRGSPPNEGSGPDDFKPSQHSKRHLPFRTVRPVCLSQDGPPGADFGPGHYAPV
jgi:hypothetical protein